MTLTYVFFLLILFQGKHFIADFPLQTDYMLRKFSPDWRVWIPALSAHAGVHAFFTFYIVVFVMHGYPYFGVPLALALAALDFVVHFTMDRIKASPNLLGRYKSLSARDYMYYKRIMEQAGNHPNVHIQVNKVFRSNRNFWWALGFDQMVHHLTHYAVIYAMVAWTILH